MTTGGNIAIGGLALSLIVALSAWTGLEQAATSLPDGPRHAITLDNDPARPAPGATAERAVAEFTAALARQMGSADPAAEAQARMTPAERDAFRMAAQGCWTYDPATPAGQSTVTVGFDLDPEGRVAGPVDLIWHDAPTPDAATEAFEAARRAILGCQTHAVPLPPETHEHSRYAEMTFEAPTRAIR